MNLKENGKKVLNFYQSIFFYIAQAKNEVLKPLGLVNETIWILTYLKVSGQQVTAWQVIGSYCFVMFVLAIAGKITMLLGIMKFNATKSNSQNPELMAIMGRMATMEETLEEIKEMVKK